MRVSLLASVAGIALPMFTLAAVFSGTVRIVLAPSVNTGALFPVELMSSKGRFMDLTNA